MKLEKVYDELYGMIEDLKKKIGAGGSQVTITPALESGTKVADYSIDGIDGVIYTPTPFIPKDYSASEQDTGLKWIDGRAIYTKTVDFGALPNNTSKDVAHGITDLDFIISISGGAKSSQYYIPLPYATYPVSDVLQIYADDTNISAVSHTDHSGYTESYITLVYVKTPPSPEPENETKNRRKK